MNFVLDDPEADQDGPKGHITKCSTISKQIITLVSLINMLHILLIIWKIPSCTFIDFGKFQVKTFIFTNKRWKIPSSTALFHHARLLIFGILPACTFIPSSTIIRETRVVLWPHRIDFKALKRQNYAVFKGIKNPNFHPGFWQWYPWFNQWQVLVINLGHLFDQISLISRTFGPKNITNRPILLTNPLPRLRRP